MNLLLLFIFAFGLAALLMYLVAVQSSSTYSAYLVRAGITASSERPPVSVFRKFFGSDEKRRVIDSQNNPLQIRFGYKKEVSYSHDESKDIAYGKAIGDSMSVRGILDGQYFVFEKGAFSNSHQAPLKIGDIVVAKIDDKSSADKGGYKLREVERLIETAHYHGVTYKNGVGTNEGEKKHLRNNIVGRVIRILD